MITLTLARWAGLIAAILLLGMAWVFFGNAPEGFMGWLAILGGALLATAGISYALRRLWDVLGPWREERRRMAPLRKIDWKVLEGGAGKVRDCEKPVTKGQCTGLECYFYEGCNLNFRKPVAR
jgi:hypothetical protein